MGEVSLKSKVAKGAVWTLLEKMSGQIVQFVVGMILARLLTPNDYGTVALTGIFFAVAGVLVDCGFGGALIQKKDADELDYNSVFYLNLILSLVVYAGLFFAAPWISDFFEVPVLKNIVRVSAVCFIFNAINAIQGAELAKKMLFHLSFRISLITCLTSAVCGVTLAFFGFGVWALVWATLISGFVGVIARWFIIAWRPKLMFSFSRLKPLFSYGWKMSVSAIIDQIYVNLTGLLIGTFYTKADLAYVGKGRTLPSMAMNEVNATLGRVTFPALVLLQNDKYKLRESMRRTMRCSTFLVFPLMVGIAACAKSELLLFYGPQWIPATPYMMLACVGFALWPFHTVNLRGILALGRSDVFLKLEIVKKTLGVIVIFSTFRLGVLPWIAISTFVTGPICVLINSWPNRRLLDYTFGMQIMDVLPTALVCIAEAAVVFGIDVACDACAPMFGVGDAGVRLNVFLACKLMLQFVFGAGVFFGLSYAFKLNPMGEYARMAVTALGGRFPRIARLLERRFLV